jgi:effector-binding domain-containing protein
MARLSMAVVTLAVAVAAPAAAQTPLAIERDPPLATRPAPAAPVLVPQKDGPPIPASPPIVAAPPVVPPGPGPVAVPPIAPMPPVEKPAVPPVLGGGSAMPHAASPAAQPAAPHPAPPAEPAQPAVPPAAATVPAPAEAPVPVPTPTPPAAAAPAPAPADAAANGVPPAPVPPPAEATPPSGPMVEEAVLTARPVLFVTGVTTWEKAEAAIARAFDTLAAATGRLGAEVTGAPLVEYIESDSDDVGYRVMLPVAGQPKAKLPKGVKFGQSPSGKALKFHNDGPIDDLEEVYGRIDDEVARRGADVRVLVEEYDADALASPEDRGVVAVWALIK